MYKYIVIIFLLIISSSCSFSGTPGPVGPPGLNGQPGEEGDQGSGYKELIIKADSHQGYNANFIEKKNGEKKFVEREDTLDLGNVVDFSFSQAESIYSVVMYFDMQNLDIPADIVLYKAILTIYLVRRQVIYYPINLSSSNSTWLINIYPVTTPWHNLLAISHRNPWISVESIEIEYINKVPIGSFSIDINTIKSEEKVEVYLDPTYVKNWINGQYNYGFIIKVADFGEQKSHIHVYSMNQTEEYLMDKRPSLRLIYK